MDQPARNKRERHREVDAAIFRLPLIDQVRRKSCALLEVGLPHHFSPLWPVIVVHLARAERPQLIALIRGGEPSQAAREEAEQLAQRTLAAKKAPFLAQYGIS